MMKDNNTKTSMKNIINHVQSDRPYEEQRFVPGESVDEHMKVEAANQFIASKELGQQNENS